MSPRRSCLLLLVLICSAASALWAQTTGEIVGDVTVEGGKALPGVAVAAFSPALQGSRLATTDSAGRYRLTLLPPGQYNVTFTAQGFSPITRNAITVSLDRSTTLDVVLQPTMQEQVKVVGEAPVDTTTTTLGTNLTERSIESIPTDRNYSSIVQIAPGISSDASNNNVSTTAAPTITVYGSSGAENAFYIDGVNTTGIEYGFQGTELNYEFIKEIDVKTGGYEAEHGRTTGGIVNVITKSGGNEFHGDVFGYNDNDSRQSRADSVVSINGTTTGFSREDYGGDLGGYFVKDTLWFFGAYDRVSNTTNTEIPAGAQAGQIVGADTTKDLGAFKLTYRMTDNQSLIATFFQDPITDTGAINDQNHPVNGDPLTYLGRQERGGKDYALRYEGILGSNWLLSGQVARHDEKNSISPESSSGDAIEYIDHTANLFQTGGFGLIQNKDLTRDFVGGAVTRFLGHHEIKFGAEYEKQTADVLKRMSGGQQVDVFANTVNPLQPIYRHFYWTTPTASLTDPGGPAISALNVSVEHKNTTLFLQDTWAILPNLTVNGGIRWDRQEIFGATGERQMDLRHDYAPRLGVIWDPTNQHKQKIFASYGRFYEQLPMDLVIRSYAFERQPRIVNYDPTSTVPDPAAESDFGTTSTILGGAVEPTDPDIKGQYIREMILGWEREIVPNVTLGVKGIQRDYRRVIEDFLCDAVNGIYCIGNPRHGIMNELFALDYVTQYPAPRPKRKYVGVQVDLTKRLSHNWTGLASYVWSRLDGNYDGEVAPYTNVGADPNISAAYDYYDFFTDGANLGRITNKGPLSNDRRHQFKVSGTYFTPFKLQIGLAAYYRTGTPLTRYGYSDAYGRYEFFLTKRGDEGRTPDQYETDVHLLYPVLAGRYSVNFLMDVFNLLNAQRPLLLDQRWGFQESDNASPTPVNPDYGKPILRTAPRSVRLGIRVSF